MWAMQQLQPHLTDGLAAMRSAQWCLIGKCGLAINAQQHLQPISKAGHGPGSTGRRDAGCPNAVCLDAACRAGQDGAWLRMGIGCMRSIWGTSRSACPTVAFSGVKATARQGGSWEI